MKRSKGAVSAAWLHYRGEERFRVELPEPMSHGKAWRWLRARYGDQCAIHPIVGNVTSRTRVETRV